MGPLLFSLYINDLPSVCDDNIHVQMYADDTAVYAHSKHPEKVAAALTEVMTRISEWLDNNQLTLNTKKTVFTYFTKKKLPAPPTIYSRDVPLDFVTAVKYLGLHLDPNLSFKTHVKEMTKKKSSGLYLPSDIFAPP